MNILSFDYGIIIIRYVMVWAKRMSGIDKGMHAQRKHMFSQRK